MTDKSKFGFTVRQTEAEPDQPAGWMVSLPHQCDRWQIAVSRWEYWSPKDQATALDCLDRFIAEANEARDALARGEQYGEDE